MKFTTILLLSLISFIAFATDEDDLAGPGLVMEVHGAPHDLGHNTGVVRDPHDFFKYTFYSLASRDPEVQKSFFVNEAT